MITQFHPDLTLTEICAHSPLIPQALEFLRARTAPPQLQISCREGIVYQDEPTPFFLRLLQNEQLLSNSAPYSATITQMLVNDTSSIRERVISIVNGEAQFDWRFQNSSFSAPENRYRIQVRIGDLNNLTGYIDVRVHCSRGRTTHRQRTSPSPDSPLRLLEGVGPKYEKRFLEHQISCIRDLARFPAVDLPVLYKNLKKPKSRLDLQTLRELHEHAQQICVQGQALMRIDEVNSYLKEEYRVLPRND
eukprot:c14855_g1_i1.p1 GENE.c14855_g1_i1~~c14855_g1_i1.p1  ORF type:complete len:248 (+),score=47.35 c14855_g1_i1:79-822(+)